MQTEDAPELTPEFLEDLRRYTEYGWGPGITAALLNRWHPVALTNLDVIRLRRRLGRAAAPAQDAGSECTDGIFRAHGRWDCRAHGDDADSRA